MRLIILLGQTCSGKSEMAVSLAKELGNSWIVNCDSRQVYKNLNIGTGKVAGEWINNVFCYKDIPHFLIDYIGADKTDFTLVDYIQDFIGLFRDSPPENIILTGGTGLYAKAISQEYRLERIKPEFTDQFNSLKISLSKMSLNLLQDYFNNLTNIPIFDKKLSIINESDFKNPRRLISRILKIEAATKCWGQSLNYPKFEQVLHFAIQIDQVELFSKIETRLQDRVNLGLLKEVKSLQYLGKKRLFDLGLEYRLTQMYIDGELDQTQWLSQMLRENLQYAKRQMTWLKKQFEIVWISSTEKMIKELRIKRTKDFTSTPTRP